MTLLEFLAQDKHCKENNTPEGKGCDECPAQDKTYCADALRNLCGTFLVSIGKPEFNEISKQLDRDYGLSQWNQLGLISGWLEFSE